MKTSSDAAQRRRGAQQRQNARAKKNDGFFPPGAKSKMSTIRTLRATLRLAQDAWETRNGGRQGSTTVGSTELNQLR